MSPARQMLFVIGVVLVGLALGLALLPRVVAPVPQSVAALPEPTTGKRIALTFDDVPRGPGAFYTPQQRTDLLIAGLQKAGVRQVAFFLNPGRISAHNGAVERIAQYTAAGHLIADHTFSHRDLSHQSAEAFLADVDEAEKWLRGRTGYRPWLRFPGLNQGGRDRDKRHAALAGLKARGLMVAPVTIDGSDWHIDGLTIAATKAGKPVDQAALQDLYVETMVQSADFADALLHRLTGRRPAQVILLHETDLAARFIGPLIEGLRRDGWTIVSADTAFADPIYRINPDVAAANGTLPEAIALQQHAPGPWYYDRNDMPVARRLFAERVLHAAPPAPALAAAAQMPHRLCPVKLHPWRRVCPSPGTPAG